MDINTSVVPTMDTQVAVPGLFTVHARPAWSNWQTVFRIQALVMQLLQNVGVKLSEILRTFMETSPPPMYVPLLLSLFIVVVLLLVVLCQRDSVPKKRPKLLAKNNDTLTRKSVRRKMGQILAFSTMHLTAPLMEVSVRTLTYTN